VKKLLSIPNEVKVVAIVSLGYQAETGTFLRRRTYEEVVRYGKF
jgi:nitroreductase